MKKIFDKTKNMPPYFCSQKPRLNIQTASNAKEEERARDHGCVYVCVCVRERERERVRIASGYFDLIATR